MIKLSVIIPLFNAEEYIVDLVKSLLVLNDLEIIIVDDGSTDNSVSLIEKNFSDKVILISTYHIGPGNARNIGVCHSVGKYVMFVDADDSLDITTLSHILKDFPSTSDIVSYTKYPVNRVITDSVQRQKLCVNILENDYSKGFIPGPVSKLYNTKFLKENKLAFPSSLKIGEDKLFNLFAIFKSHKITIINESFYHYRNNPKSLTKLYKEGSIFEEILLLQEIKKFIEVTGLNCDYQYVAIRYWINDVTNALNSGASNEAVSEYRKFILSEFSRNEIYKSKLSHKRKLILALLMGEHYTILRVLKRISSNCTCKKIEKETYTNI